MLSRLRLRLPTRAYSTLTNFHCNVVVVSIGNPSPDYDGTRHSVGHYVLEKVRSQFLEGYPRFSSESVQTSEPNETSQSSLLLARSVGSYMNLQGRPVAKFWHKYTQRNPRASLVVIHDELQIPMGKVQIRRRNTSARGHNGLRSIDNAMGNDYTKIAVGIGKPLGKSAGTVSDYVLSKFTRGELDVLEETVVPRVAEVLLEMAKGKHVHERHEK